MRSSSGPEMRFWYLVTVPGEQVQSLQRIAVITARAGVHRTNKLKTGRESQRALGAADGDQSCPPSAGAAPPASLPELGQLIQEQHPAVRQRNFARVGPVAAAHQPGVRDGVVRGAERALLDQRYVRRELVGHRIDAGHIQRFVDAHARQDARHRARQQGLARSGGPDKKYIMRTGRRHLQGALDMLLAFDLAEVGLGDLDQCLGRHTGLRGAGALRRAGGRTTPPAKAPG